ncbi:NYN domain-containing protein [Selenomonas sp.]|uniref:NYN domain-containing protein n=1 Tax=Selenomonas sp. TaxID=2053611 RepID=UPI002A7F461F|nr:NYN domain-containing protein [Selenomonas sp.]MDY4415036.1 NYN domain-containing protein [Selenomonas sp.]
MENAPFEMLDYTLGKARRFQPCRIIVVTDWDKVPEDQKRWERLRRRPGFTFRPVTRTYLGKNSLDNALFDSALVLYKDGVRRFFIITTDSDFVKIAEALNSGEKSYIIGVGTKQASETLRSAYDEFLCYPPEKPEKPAKKPRKAKAEKPAKDEKKDVDAKAAQKAEKTKKKTKAAKAQEEVSTPQVQKTASAKKAQPKTEPQKQMKPETKKDAPAKKITDAKAAAKPAKAQKKAEPPKPADTLTIRLPRTLQRDLDRRKDEEGVSMDELVTYLLMRGIHS